MEDTIAAISTSSGAGAISIVRLSGKEAISIANEIFKGHNLSTVDSHTIHYGFITNGTENIDEVLISVMRAPKTYTTEDIVEINCHGGVETTNEILYLVLQKGARLAEAGEFTKRAFLNGRINLVEAESVSDLITSKSEEQRKMAMNGLNGRLTKNIQSIREKILNLLANIEVNIDYPEYDDAIDVTTEHMKNKTIDIKKDLELLLDNAEIGKIIKSGIDIALIGRPNVGKSSLLNALINEDKAIVTDISGTTRDVIEAKFFLKGIEINLIDTAGIRETTDTVEKIGVDKSKKIINEADLIILVLNSNEALTKEDEQLLENIKNKKHIIFLNKSDLPLKLELAKDFKYIMGNTKDLDGLESLKNEIIKLYNLDGIAKKDGTYLSNIRQIDLVKKALNEVNIAYENADGSIPVDMLEINLRSAWEYLGILIGETYEDELVDKLFKNFCLGK